MFGDVVRAHRRRMGMSQDDLAAKASIGVRSLRDIELNKISRARPGTVRLLADALGLEGRDRDDFFALAADRRAPVGPATVWPRPAQLPPEVVGFAGRAGVLRRLDQLLDAGEPMTVVISAIAGTAGVGKTALAVHWAHRIARQFPDGQLYVNLRGFDPSGSTMTPGEAIRGFLDAFAIPAERVPSDVDAQVGLYRSLVSGRRMLVVLDNARDADQVRPLLPGAAGCLVVVTSRNDLTGLVAAEGARPLTLEPMPADDAARLLARRIGTDRVTAEPEAVDEIIVRCGGLPLALAVVAARAAARPTLTLARLAADLGRSGLEALTGSDPATDVRGVFGWSYRNMRDGAARMFRLLGTHPGPAVSLPAAASLAAVTRPQARQWLGDLTAAHLLTETASGRYAFHDLLRVYACELARSTDGDQRRPLVRLFDHYVHTGHTAALLLQPHREPLTMPAPASGVQPEALHDAADAVAWFSTEQDVLVAAVERAGAGFEAHAWRLAWALVDFFDMRGIGPVWLATQEIALDAARRLGDRRMEAMSRRFLGRADIRLGRHEEAERHFTAALDLFGEVGDIGAQATTYHSIALLVGARGRSAEAVEQGERALEMFRSIDHVPGQARAHNTVGWYLGQLGHLERALSHCERALRLHERLGNAHGLSATWDSLAYVHHQMGRHHEAVQGFRKALEIGEGLDRGMAVRYLTHLGEAHLAAGEVADARSAWQRALTIFEELDDPEAAVVRARLDELGGT